MQKNWVYHGTIVEVGSIYFLHNNALGEHAAPALVQ
jgi:hypothetical protein